MQLIHSNISKTATKKDNGISVWSIGYEAKLHREALKKYKNRIEAIIEADPTKAEYFK